tara:strand:- start:6005 stop:6394 length:390 start_codon:yes stop_codon:yes gene_type:complete
MYGLKPNTVYEASIKVMSESSLDCCTAAFNVYEVVHGNNPLHEFGVSDAKDLIRLIREMGSLYKAIDYGLTTLGFIQCSPDVGQICFLDKSLCICISKGLYAVKGKDSVTIVARSDSPDNKVSSWKCQQ